MTTGKTIALTTWTFVGKVISLLFNMLSWLVITFLPSAGGTPQREAVELPSAKLRGPEERRACCPPTQPLRERETIRRARDNQTRQGFPLSSFALLPQTLGLYRQARGFCEGLSIVAPITLKVKSSCAIVAPITLKVKSQYAIVAPIIKGQIVICHSCTNLIKGQIIMCLHYKRSLW